MVQWQCIPADSETVYKWARQQTVTVRRAQKAKHLHISKRTRSVPRRPVATSQSRSMSPRWTCMQRVEHSKRIALSGFIRQPGKTPTNITGGGGSHTCLAGRELHPLPNFQVIQRQFKKKGHKHNARWQMAAAAARAALGNLLSDLGWNARYQDADVRHTRQATFSNPPSARIIHNHLHH